MPDTDQRDRRIELEMEAMNRHFDSVEKRLSSALLEIRLLHGRLDAIGVLIDRMDRPTDSGSGGGGPTGIEDEVGGGWTRTDALFQEIKRIADGTALESRETEE